MLWLNVSVAGLALVASLAISVVPAGEDEPVSQLRRWASAPVDVVEREGRTGFVDATNTFVPIADYRRIVSASTVTDGMLLALCEPNRVLRFTRYSAEQSIFRYRFAGKGAMTSLVDVEPLIALEPDLILTHNIGSPERVARLRESGLTVFDFGSMHGLRTLLPNLRVLGALLGRPERGQQIAARFERRMANIAATVPEGERPDAVYVGIHGDKIYGGTDGSSYHDVLSAAGLHDVAAAHFDGWPTYTSEQLIDLNPEVVVTTTGMERSLCRHPGLGRIRACQPGGQVIGLDRTLIGAPGLDMLEAAEAVYEAVHLHGRSD